MSAPEQATKRKRPPLVVTESGGSYPELFWLIEKLPMVRHKDQVLPKEIIHKIAHFFTIEKVVSSEVVAVRASSSNGRHPLQESLTTNKNTWWISAFGNMPRGQGEEFVEFQMTNKKATTLRRLSSVSIEIPPLPMGPLSVRTMRIDCKFGDTWRVVSPIYTVQNKTGWQQYKLPNPVDAELVRVVCLTNQMSQFLPDPGEVTGFRDEDFQQFAAIGYYCVKFE